MNTHATNPTHAPSPNQRIQRYIRRLLPKIEVEGFTLDPPHTQPGPNDSIGYVALDSDLIRGVQALCDGDPEWENAFTFFICLAVEDLLRTKERQKRGGTNDRDTDFLKFMTNLMRSTDPR
jgi:hypothetical protein